jgi:hypothetical protein
VALRRARRHVDKFALVGDEQPCRTTVRREVAEPASCPAATGLSRSAKPALPAPGEMRGLFLRERTPNHSSLTVRQVGGMIWSADAKLPVGRMAGEPHPQPCPKEVRAPFSLAVLQRANRPRCPLLELSYSLTSAR